MCPAEQPVCISSFYSRFVDLQILCDWLMPCGIWAQTCKHVLQTEMGQVQNYSDSVFENGILLESFLLWKIQKKACCADSLQKRQLDYDQKGKPLVFLVLGVSLAFWFISLSAGVWFYTGVHPSSRPYPNFPLLFLNSTPSKCAQSQTVWNSNWEIGLFMHCFLPSNRHFRSFIQFIQVLRECRVGSQNWYPWGVVWSNSSEVWPLASSSCPSLPLADTEGFGAYPSHCYSTGAACLCWNHISAHLHLHGTPAR